MLKLLLRFLGVFALVLAAGAVAGQSDLPTATITLSEDGLVAPETLTAGWVEITFEATDEAPLLAFLARLDDDASMDDFMAALMGIMGGDAGIIPPATFIGAPAVMPGAPQSVTYNLAAGSYILLNIAGGQPQITTFAVEGDSADADFEPEADLTVSLVDFAFGLPTELVAGEQTWLIENLGQQWHELALIPVPDGTTLEEAMSLLMANESGESDESGEAGETGEEEAEGGAGAGPQFAAFWSPMSAGERAWVKMNLTPGTYLVSCFIPDVHSDEHASHAALGMVQIVTVTEADGDE